MGLLDVLADFFEALPFRYLLVGHCLAVSSWLTHLSPHFMQSYWIGFLAAFGGGTVTALVIGDRELAPLAVLSNNGVGVAWTLCWWLLNYSPASGALERLLEGFLPLKVACKACVSVLRAQLISSRVDLAVKAHPGVVAAPLILGTLAGGAGKLVTDPLLRHAAASSASAGGRRRTSSAAAAARTEFSSPGFSLRSAALGALFQAAAAHWIGFLSERQAGAALVAALVAHGAAVDVASWWSSGEGKRRGGPLSLDFTAAPAALLHSISRIPVPHDHLDRRRSPAATTKKTAATPATATRSSSRDRKAA